MLTEAFAEPRERYDIEMPLDALVSLVSAFNEGIILERLAGIETGHAQLLDWIDGWLERGEGMATAVAARAREQTRARYPDVEGYVERDGVRSSRRSTARGETTVLLVPTWSIVHSRHWKMQMPYLARHCRVVTFDGRGNGRSDRPRTPAAYDEGEFAADALAVLDATETERAIVVSLVGAQRGLLRARAHRARRGPVRDRAGLSR